MKPFRDQTVYLSPEVYWMGKVLNKKLCQKAKDNPLTVDEFVNGELRNLWTNQNPELVLGWEKHQEARQKHKKVYDLIEEEALKGGRFEPMEE